MSETITINIITFCNWQGLGANDRFVLCKKFKPEIAKTYDEWYDELQHQIALSDKRTDLITTSKTKK